MLKRSAGLAFFAVLAYSQTQQASSTYKHSREGDAEVVEITNVNFEVAGANPLLILRKTTQTREVIGDIGQDATTTVEAWPLGADLKQKPLYSITVSGIDPVTKENELLVVSRGLEEVEWWSVYKLSTGAHLFDSYTTLLQFNPKDGPRFAGLEVPPDDTPPGETKEDPRLKIPNVVAVLTYASGDHVIREAMITCDNAKRAQLLRSYADAKRSLTYGTGGLRLQISQSDPSRSLATIVIPVTNDNLDFARAQVPAGLHVRAWER